MTDRAFEHPWLGTLRPHGDRQLLGQIEIDTPIRPNRLNGEADAEVLINIGSVHDHVSLHALADAAAVRIRSVLADLPAIKTFALAHAPVDWLRRYEDAEPTPLQERLFLEGFWVLSPDAMEVAFDFDGLDLLVVVVDAFNCGRTVRLAP